MAVMFFHVDAFTNVPFKGNPAVVCLLPEEGDPQWMQQFAREMNLSETAFLYRIEEGFSLRWFTPLTEVELCGHATLASAHALWEAGEAPQNKPISFMTLSGKLTASKANEWIELNFPASYSEPCDLSDYYLDALGITPLAVFQSNGQYLIEMGEEAAVRAVKPDFSALRRLPGKGIIITARSNKPGIDFVSRYFAPWIGINEDPVTGSAHTILGPYWQKKLSKDHMTGYQVSKRGGSIKIRMSGERVYISGQAVTISRGLVTAYPGS